MSALAPAPRAPRSPWQRLYAAALAGRRRRAAARATKLARPVVSVGNLHWGGGGKTPFTIALAEHLRDGGRRVAILSRGYRRASRGPLVVSRGTGPLVAAAAAGDEPHLLAARLPGVAVVVGERRAAAGELALATLAPDLFLLDDGFSHVALVRDLDLLVFPAADPWAGGRLLPSGRLREPLAAAAAADAVVLTGVETDAECAGAALAHELAPYGYRGPGFASATVARRPRLVGAGTLAPDAALYAVAAIARPDGFFAAAHAAGLRLVGARDFRDHHAFSPADLRAIDTAAARSGAAAVLATEKDLAKLAGRLATPLAVLPIDARPEPAFWRWFDARLAELAR